MTRIFNIFAAAMTTAIVGAMAMFVAVAAGNYTGTWQVKDSSGNAFKIMLNKDGSATANRQGEGMKGTWNTEGEVAVIEWDSGWTTKIMEEGDGYKKTAFKKGADTSGDPTNTSDASKVSDAEADTPMQDDSMENGSSDSGTSMDSDSDSGSSDEMQKSQ